MTESAELERRLVEFFATHAEDAAAVYLFGSAARGTARPDSDVDVGILFAQTPAPTLDAQPYGLAADLEIYLGQPVDVEFFDLEPIPAPRSHAARTPLSAPDLVAKKLAVIETRRSISFSI